MKLVLPLGLREFVWLLTLSRCVGPTAISVKVLILDSLLHPIVPVVLEPSWWVSLLELEPTSASILVWATSVVPRGTVLQVLYPNDY